MKKIFHLKNKKRRKKEKEKLRARECVNKEVP
jgi:hypothetical protein